MLPIVILAGGLATRLHPITHNLPKSMLEINGAPFAHWQTKLLAQAGFSEIIYCVSHKSGLITNFLGDGSKYGVEIRYSFDGPVQLGTGGAIAKALPMLEGDFMVLYGDSYLPIDYKSVINEFSKCKKPAMMTVYANRGMWDKSNVEYKNHRLISYKKGHITPELTHIDYGLSCFKKDIFSKISDVSPTDLADIFSDLVLRDELAAFEIFERFYEIGSPTGIDDFAKYLERNLNEL